MFTIQLFSALLVLSAVIAFVGDIVGRNLGRRRWSIFGLRPRSTARLITTLTGILITFFSVAIMLLISDNARIAFFNLENLKNNYSEKSSELQNLNLEIKLTKESLKSLNAKFNSTKKEADIAKGEILKLKENKEDLQNEIEALKITLNKLSDSILSTREGKVILKANEPIISTVVKKDASQKETKKTLENMLISADQILRAKGFVSTEKNNRAVWLDDKEFADALSHIERHRNDNLAIRIISDRNTIAGEPAIVHFEIFKNALIFKANELIAQEKIIEKLTKLHAQEKIQTELKKINLLAQNKGILASPLGLVGNVSFELIYETAEKISLHRLPFVLKFSAAQDTYTIGPLEIKIEIE